MESKNKNVNIFFCLFCLDNGILSPDLSREDI